MRSDTGVRCDRAPAQNPFYAHEKIRNHRSKDPTVFAKNSWVTWLLTLIVVWALGFGTGFSLHYALTEDSPEDATLVASAPATHSESESQRSDSLPSSIGASDDNTIEGTPPTNTSASDAVEATEPASEDVEPEPAEPLPTTEEIWAARHLFIALNGQWLAQGTKELLRETRPGGVVLRESNLRDPSQTLALIQEIKEATGLGQTFQDLPLIAVDQEGGPKNTLALAHAPSASELGLTQDPSLARRVGQTFGEACAERGINIILAPVLDVNDEDGIFPSMTWRSFGSDRELVADMGLSLASGIMDRGVLAVARHFPGYGGASYAEDGILMVLNKDRRTVAKTMYPFSEAVAKGIPGMIVGHIAVPVLDPDHPTRLASASPKLVRELIRDRWNYEGVIIADDVALGPMAAARTPERAVVESLAAGCDAVLLLDPSPTRIRSVIAAIEQAVIDGELSMDALSESKARLDGWSEWLADPKPLRGFEPETNDRLEIAKRLVEPVTRIEPPSVPSEEVIAQEPLPDDNAQAEEDPPLQTPVIQGHFSDPVAEVQAEPIVEVQEEVVVPESPVEIEPEPEETGAQATITDVDQDPESSEPTPTPEVDDPAPEAIVVAQDALEISVETPDEETVPDAEIEPEAETPGTPPAEPPEPPAEEDIPQEDQDTELAEATNPEEETPLQEDVLIEEETTDQSEDVAVVEAEPSETTEPIALTEEPETPDTPAQEVVSGEEVVAPGENKAIAVDDFVEDEPIVLAETPVTIEDEAPTPETDPEEAPMAVVQEELVPPVEAEVVQEIEPASESPAIDAETAVETLNEEEQTRTEEGAEELLKDPETEQTSEDATEPQETDLTIDEAVDVPELPTLEAIEEEDSPVVQEVQEQPAPQSEEDPVDESLLQVIEETAEAVPVEEPSVEVQLDAPDEDPLLVARAIPEPDAILTTPSGIEIVEVRHTVLPGETLGKIAAIYGVRASAIKEWNELPTLTINHGIDLLLYVAPEIAARVGTQNDPEEEIKPRELTHTVRDGETLTKIAAKYEVDLRDLVIWNRLSDYRLQAGQSLIVFVGEDNKGIKAKPPRVTIYRVRRGDNLTRIAERHGTTKEVVMMLNDIRNANHIFIGQRLKMPTR